MEGLTLVINAGSSSVKFTLFSNEHKVMSGIVDRIGGESILLVQGSEGSSKTPVKAPDYRTAGQIILDILGDRRPGLIVHRMVHGGQNDKPVLLTPQSIKKMRKLVSLAPLHLPPALELIEFFKGSKGVAVFDTLFHRTIPMVAKTYAIPEKLAHKHGIERYGFHGMAHASMLHQVAKGMGKRPNDLNIITVQMGNGVSVCAIRRGKSVETSMGFTPLEGCVMGSRSGSIDPAIIPFLCKEEGLSVAEVDYILQHESGLKAIGGHSDVRDLLGREHHGVAKATLALDVFVHWIKKYIGAYTAVLGKVDAVVLGGGISDAPAMRWSVLEGLNHLGIKLNPGEFWKDGPVKISYSSVQAWVVKVDEDSEMLKMAWDFLKR